MRRPVVLAALAALVASTLLLAPPGLADDHDTGATRLGEPLTLEHSVPLATVLADPDAYEGERIQVEGRVEAVCTIKGCWMKLADDAGHQLRVQVEDDGPVSFPLEAVGRDATVEGILTIIPMERERFVAWRQHLADDAGETFDPSSVPAEGPFERVEIRGLGASIAAAEAAPTRGGRR